MASGFRMHPWSADTLLTDTDFRDEGGDERVHVGIEIAAADWRALEPAVLPDVRTIHFVDGARRHDALLYYEFRACLLALVSVGCVTSRYGEPARVEAASPRRFVVCGCGSEETFELPAIEIGTLGITYEPLVTRAGTELSHLSAAAHQAMQAWEADVASDVATRFPADVIVCDGPRPRGVPHPNVLGYLKTVVRERLADVQRHVAYGLETGRRTPVYLLERPRGDDVYEWVIRPRPVMRAHDERLGLVRLQATAELPLEEVRRLADWSAATLPLYSTDYHQDGRAPEQLLIIKSLENHLRRHFGHPELLRTHLRRALAGITS